MRRERWFSTEEAAQVIGGVNSRWVRKQIEDGRLRARVLLTGSRPTYRIREVDLARFRAAFIVEDSRDRDA